MIQVRHLQEVCEITMGQAPDGSSYNSDGVGLPLIAGAGHFGNGCPATERFTTAPMKVCTTGDIVLGIRATIGEKVIADRAYCLGRGVAGLRPKKNLDDRFLWHWLDFARASLVAKAKGATFKQVNFRDVAELEIACPPFRQQQRIASILDQADALRAKRHTALVQVDALTQSIFIDVFGDPIANPKRWDESIRLDEIADITSGVTKGRKLNGKPTRTIPYLAVANVQDRSLNLATIKSIEATEDEIARYRLRKNDLLLTEGGDPDKLGRGALWSGEIEECIHQNHIFRVRLRDGVPVEPLFLDWLVGGPRGKRYFLASAKQTTGIASINMTQLRGFPLLVPPRALQLAFAARHRVVEALKKREEQALAETNAVFASLQHRAFRGEL